MDVHIYFILFELIVLLIDIGHPAFTSRTIKMCKHRLCILNCICNAHIQCEAGTKIEVTEVKYRENSRTCESNQKFCDTCCSVDFNNIPRHTNSIMDRCNGLQTCSLDSWNTEENWKMKISYVCNEPFSTTQTTVSTSTMQTTSVKPTETTTLITTQPSGETTNSSSPHTETRYSSSSTTVKSSSQSPEHSTDSGRIVKTKEEESGFPLGAIIAIPVGIVVMILLIVGIVCAFRRRSHGTQQGRKANKSTLPMQDMTANDNDNSTLSGIREQQENHEQDYVDTTTHKGKTISKHRVEQEYVDTDRGGIHTTDDDEYNTLNTHQPPVQIDPNYDHLPKDSHTTVDETYSHVTDSQTKLPDATYSHLQDSKLNASNNVKSNQNNSDNVYNHTHTLSVEDNVYNNTKTNFTQNLTSNLSQARSEEDDYDHTDWNQAKSQNPIASHSGAINKSVGDNITEDEYAVVNKRSDDKVESNDGHNYFVLEEKYF